MRPAVITALTGPVAVEVQELPGAGADVEPVLIATARQFCAMARDQME